MDEIENDPQAIQDEAPPEDQAQPLPRAINVATQRRRSRLFSHQPIVEEDVLDNEVNNSQQQFEDIDMQQIESDRLFDEYLQENTVEEFDTELPTNHSYLGPMDKVSGINLFEVGKVYQLPVRGFHSILFPGETIPMITAESIFELNMPGLTNQSSDGLFFGLVFWDEAHNNQVYGVTCQVYEKGVDSFGNITIKSKANQRFVVVKKNGNLTDQRGSKYFANVKILPEIVLPDPLLRFSSNNLAKFTQNNSQYSKLRNFIASASVWPVFVYNHYETISVQQKIKQYLSMLNIDNIPTDPVLLSFWLARNVPLSNKERISIFISNCVTQRMKNIGKSLNKTCYFSCRRCLNRIAEFNDVFAMSKQGVQTTYCNPAGYIHETLTVYKTIESSNKLVDRPSKDFSWFPGYAWQISVCYRCAMHVGWKFIAINHNLKPRSFYGLSGKSIEVETNERPAPIEEDTDDSSTTDEDD